MTVFENVAYGLKRRKVSKGDIIQQVAQVLDMVQLAGLAERYPRQLSGGQQQRVAVARAIIIRPSVLLFDEPLSNLDAKLRQEMRGELRRLQQHLEIATIFVTHDQDEALDMADRVVVMNQGRVEQVGTPETIYSRPQTRFVANFIGECNFLTGRVIALKHGIASFTVGDLTVNVTMNGVAESSSATGTLALRPESIRVLATNESPPRAFNIVEGQVREVTYLGASRRYRVALTKGPELLVYQQGGYGPRLREGDAVRVAWDPASGSFQLDGIDA
jgi:ABC-type Fe3+/spermidine/putrescine transport system ATPase subunit